MLDRPFHVGLAALSLGLAAAGAGAGMPALALAAALLVAVIAALRRPVLGVVAGLLLLSGFALGAERLEALDAPTGALAAGERFAGRVTVLEHPRPSSFGSSALVEIDDGSADGLRLLARFDRRGWPGSPGPGARLAVEGRIGPLAGGRAAGVRAAEPSGREPAGAGAESERARRTRAFAEHLRRRGVVAELELEHARPSGVRSGLAGIVDGIRRRAELALADGLHAEHAALARGMVLGQDEAIGELVRQDFRTSGLAHLLAVSGQNVALLGALAVPVLGLLGIGGAPRILAVLALIAVYVPLAGAGPSLQRAGIMGAAALVATAAARPASRAYALLLAAAGTLALSPRAAGDPGWQLSFCAVIGIALLAPGLSRAMAGVPRPLADGLAMTLAASLVTAPLLSLHFGAVSLAGLAANLAALPVVAPIMWLGTLRAAIGQLSGLPAPVAPLVDVALAGLGHLHAPCLAYLQEIARRFAELPGAEVAVRLAGPVALAAAWIALALVVLAVVGLWRRRTPVPLRGSALARTPLLLTGLLAALVLGAARLGAGAGPPDELTVSFLDVGQGDATLIQHPDGSAVLFDGGPADARVIRSIRAAGVRRLSTVVATHASADHQGGLVEVLERMPVELLVDGGDGSRDPGFLAVLAAAERRGVPRVPARAGQVLRAGGLTVRVLSPPPRPPGPPPEDPNPRAVVAVVSAGGFDLLLSADAESEALLPLALGEVEAMKVPHHGSSDPGLSRVLGRLAPEVAVIEVGENSYGHPAPETLSALRSAVPHVRRTDRHGTVTLRAGPGGIELLTERESDSFAP